MPQPQGVLIADCESLPQRPRGPIQHLRMLENMRRCSSTGVEISRCANSSGEALRPDLLRSSGKVLGQSREHLDVVSPGPRPSGEVILSGAEGLWGTMKNLPIGLIKPC